MATIGKLRVSFGGGDEAMLSLGSVCDALVAGSSCLETGIDPVFRFGDECGACFLQGLLDSDDLIRFENSGASAGPAGEFLAGQVLPSDRYLDLVTALSAERVVSVSFSHGWPILSSVCCSTTMADEAAESIRSLGSAA